MTDIPKGFKENAVRWVVVKNRYGGEIRRPSNHPHTRHPPPAPQTPTLRVSQAAVLRYVRDFAAISAGNIG
jgi:hypothetical protein